MADLTNPPKHCDVAHLRAGGALPLVHLIGNFVCLLAGLWLVTYTNWPGYIIGQVLLGFVLLHAFVLLHEAGHRTLFRNRRLNTFVGHYAGALSVIPFASWRPIHARHHKYTGWQDLDATTATLVPRKLMPWERLIIDGAWRSGLPLFSTLYRLQNYWHIPRINSFLKSDNLKRRIILNAILLLLAYAAVIAVLGFGSVLITIGPALFIALATQDMLLLSQHTHIPQNLSHGETVTTFPPHEQAQFSRSLRLPGWLSTLLMHFDAHELHHMYPEVPGYHLRGIDYRPPNEMPWFVWLRAAKRLKGTDFLFRNRDETGAKL